MSKTIEKLPHRERRAEDQFADLIMTPQEYRDKAHRGNKYLVDLKKGDKELLAYGAQHFNDPEDSNFLAIREALQTRQPSLVLVEGMRGINKMSADEIREALQVSEKSNEEMVRQYGEPAYTVQLAIERGIAVYSPEPAERDNVVFAIEQGSSIDDIFVEQISTIIDQYQRVEDKPSLEEYLAPYLSRIKKEWGFSEYDFSFDNYQRLLSQYTDKDFDVSDERLFSELSDPIPWSGLNYGPTNVASARFMQHRDRYIIGKVQEFLAEHDSIVMVYGKSHVEMLEPALREMFND